MDALQLPPKRSLRLGGWQDEALHETVEDPRSPSEPWPSALHSVLGLAPFWTPDIPLARMRPRGSDPSEFLRETGEVRSGGHRRTQPEDGSSTSSFIWILVLPRPQASSRDNISRRGRQQREVQRARRPRRVCCLQPWLHARPPRAACRRPRHTDEQLISGDHLNTARTDQKRSSFAAGRHRHSLKPATE